MITKPTQSDNRYVPGDDLLEDIAPLTRQELTAIAIFIVVQRGARPGQAFKQTLIDVHSLTRRRLINLIFAERLGASALFAFTFMATAFRRRRPKNTKARQK